ncbi:hypothetical protein [Capnocytophaga canis]|uniref:hypothetical protein n=1 Tax=Capnocytophaga canis TaxID=1848903 RepID=UPI001F511D35|nr:hypothetical protein [Capnocytophaga canis]
MRNWKFKPLNLLLNIAILFVVLTTVFSLNPATALASSIPLGVVTGTALSFVDFKSVALEGLQVEIWAKTIQEKLREDNTFLQHISDVDAGNILAGKVVHLPQAGAPSKVVKNRQTLPAEVKQRKDAEVLYSIDEYTTDPVHIPYADTVELSYDKRRSILDQDIANLSDEVAEGMLTNIIVSPVGNNKSLPQKNILLTESSVQVNPSLEGATGKRKAYNINDLQRMRAMFKRGQKSWSENNMYALLTEEAMIQMFPADSVTTATYMQSVTEQERREGVVLKCQGWKILTRGTVYHMGNDKSFKAFGAVVTATDTEGCLFWNKNMVEKAIGTTQIFERLNDPTYYGDIYSFLVRVGGRARRAEFEGVGVLMQASAG